MGHGWGHRPVRPLTTFVHLQFTLKLAASDLFLGKKESYPASVPKPFLTSHLCTSILSSAAGRL